MKQPLYYVLSVFCLLCMSSACNDSARKTNIDRYAASTDPFRSTIVAAQYFNITTTRDTVLQGKNGTILVCPARCFLDTDGTVVEGPVTLELREALSLNDMVLSNLTTSSDSQFLETGGMIFFDATANGRPLSIAKDNPVHIEIPAAERKADMMVYKGTRDGQGNMRWSNPQKLDDYLVPVDMALLDFLPEGFRDGVEAGMPFRGYQTATDTLTDSLYYALAAGTALPVPQSPDLDEPRDSKRVKVMNGKYVDASYVESDTSSVVNAIPDCGVDPAAIKVLKTGKYQHTLIATREFEARLKVIFKTCRTSLLELYALNTDKNLYELDSMAAVAMKGTPFFSDFDRFYQQKLTNVREADKYAALLKGYYQKRLRKVKKELDKAREAMAKAAAKHEKEVKQLTRAYQKLLKQREAYRMTSYGFSWTSTGWVNIDRGTLPKTWAELPLEIWVPDASQYDRIYTYVLFENINSLYRMNTDGDGLFYVGRGEQRRIPMAKHGGAMVVTIAYKQEQAFLGIQSFQTGSGKRIEVPLKESSVEYIRDTLNTIDKALSVTNKITVDLDYMERFYEEAVKRKSAQKEAAWINKLWSIAHPCCTQ